VTWAHHALLHNDRQGLKMGLWLTVILGILFTACQAFEYSHAAFKYSGNIYGATFFMATGFHGAHVIIGTVFLAVCLLRTYKGHHTRVVQLHHRYGMIFFIASEVMFFVAWFWAYFDASLYANDPLQYSRSDLTGGNWPPKGIETFDPWHLPLFNTLILLTSGTTVTWAHHALLHGDRKGLKWGLWLTIALGFLFTCVQAYEYGHAAFSFSGNIYGATFFMATGFHGAHVIIGTIFLAVCLLRVYRGHFTPTHHLGFEFAAWYWHFVDVVWLFLFAAIYVWGAGAEAGAAH
jgi:cytochrome c oxidase subunit 3